MTRIAKSDSQLDAEAAAPLEERDLTAAIATHRALFRGDIDWLMKTHVRDGESGMGPPFSPAFLAFLEMEWGMDPDHRAKHPGKDFAGPSGQEPWHRAYFGMRFQTCRQTHAPKHTERREWRGSLCGALVHIVIREHKSLTTARLRLGLPEEGRTKRTLDNALLAIERRLEDQYRAQDRDQQADTSRTPAEWMAGEYHQRHDQPGAHRAECPQCIRRRAAA